MIINGSTTINDVKYLLLHKMLVENKSKNQAARETIKELDVSSITMINALRKVDAHIEKKYGDKVYYMVCLTQTQWITNCTSCGELINEGFSVKKDVSGDADYSVCVEDCMTAKLFEAQSDAIKFLYGSSSVTPLPVAFAEPHPKALPKVADA